MYEKIMEYFDTHEETFIACLEELDNYNGYLGDNRYYPMEELNEFYTNCKPMDILFRAFYGHDDETWTIHQSGEKEYGSFNPNREYFYYNGYGNLVSADYKDYSAWNDKWAIEAMNENREHINAIRDNDELSKLFEELFDELN